MNITKLSALLQALHQALLHAFPPDFRRDFGPEMAQVLDRRLADAAEQGPGAIIALGARELGHMPAALLRVRLYRWRKKRQRLQHALSHVSRATLFAIPPPDADGRFSTRHLLLELAPFLLAALVLLRHTYQPGAAWPRLPLALWGAALPLLALLLGLARGMPRWAYGWGGLLAGITLHLAAQQRLLWLWLPLLAAALLLAISAALAQKWAAQRWAAQRWAAGPQPLPRVVQRLGASIALDWTRLSFGLFGAAPLLILAAFDNTYVNNRTPYLALALLLMLLTALLYSRSRRQDRQLAILLLGTTLLFAPALLDHLYWQSDAALLSAALLSAALLSAARWLLGLWAWSMALLLLPLLAPLTRLVPTLSATSRHDPPP